MYPAYGRTGPTLLDPGNSNRLPLLVENPPGETICWAAMPATPEGDRLLGRGMLATGRANQG